MKTTSAVRRVSRAIPPRPDNVVDPTGPRTVTAGGALLLVIFLLAGAAAAAPTVELLSDDPALEFPSDMVTDGINLYMINTAGGVISICSVPIGGGPVTTLYSALTSPYGITMLGNDLFWVDPNSGPISDTQILRAPKDGSGPITAIYTGSAVGQPIVDGSGITTDGTKLYTADMYNGRVHSLNLDGTGLVQLGPERYGGGFSNMRYCDVAEAGGTLYVMDRGKDADVPEVTTIPSGGAPAFTPLHEGAPFVGGSSIKIAEGDGTLYVTDYAADNTIWELPVTGGPPTEVVSGGPFIRVNGIAYYDGTLYITDAGGPGAGAVYRVTIAETPPVADPQTVNINEDAVDVAITLTASDAEDGTPSFTSRTDPANGTLTGTMPNLVYNPDPNYNGTDGFDFTVTDAGGLTDTATVTIQVAAANDPPTVAVPIPDQGATEDVLFSYQVPANTFDDVDVGDTLTYAAALAGGSPLPAWLSFDAATQTFSGTPTNAEVGTISVEVTATDAASASVFDTFDITVANTNDPPVANDDTASTAADTAVVIDVLANDTDVDAGDTLSISTFTQGSNGAVTEGGGTLTYGPGSGFSGMDTFTYTASDGNGGTDTATVTVTVTTAGAFPPLTGFTATARSERRIDLAWTSPDDPGFAGVVIFRGQGAAPTFVPVDGTSYTPGTAYGDATCVYAGADAGLIDDEGGTGLTAATQYHYVIHALDGAPSYSGGASADATTTAVIPPTVVSTSPVDGAADALLTAPVTVTFSEPMDTTVDPGTVLSVRAGGVDVPGAVTWSADGTAVTFTPAASLEEGTTYTVEVATAAADEAGNAMTDVQTFTFTTRTPAGGVFGGGCSAGARSHGEEPVALAWWAAAVLLLLCSARWLGKGVRTPDTLRL